MHRARSSSPRRKAAKADKVYPYVLGGIPIERLNSDLFALRRLGQVPIAPGPDQHLGFDPPSAASAACRGHRGAHGHAVAVTATSMTNGQHLGMVQQQYGCSPISQGLACGGSNPLFAVGFAC
jgi:hypothetical protein